ncbi:major facilitator superfamily domain-containing protein [Plectosphaerella plurivora]|uniref:Major facilitator superfamily domain-containing protein n=1 Tax=Plectosphaerella plurivora TaxID=936078 RepID=A0A9P9A9U8_9PEZI|nr:major facilitator superfamily domain-containing protein [Plectosphaerella plurivora]
MTEQRKKVDEVDDQPDVIQVELLTMDDEENYSGLTVKCILVYVSILAGCFAQVLAIVATGAFSRNVAAVVGGMDKYIWIPQGLVICITFTAAPIAQASDFWGRRLPILICTALCLIGSIVISRATSMTMAIAGALLVGVGSGSTSLLYAVASEILPRRYRPAAQAGVNIANSLGGILTILAGFSLVKENDEGFRVIWYIGTGLFAINFIVIFVLFKPPQRHLEISLTLRQKLRALDWIGYFLFSIGMILFSVGLTWANNPFPWTNAHVLSTFVVGVAFIILTVVWEVERKVGFCHRSLFEDGRTYALALVFIFIEGFTFFAVNNFLPLEFSILFESDEFMVGVLVSIIFIAGTAASVFAGFYSTKTKRVRPPLLAGMGLFVIYFACMATIKLDQSAAIWGFTVLAGLGLGFGLVIAVTTGQMSTPPGLIATASGLILTARALGGSVSLPVYTAILNSKLSKHLGPQIAERVLPLGLSAEDLPAFINALAGNDRKALASIPGVNPAVIDAGLLGLRTAYRLGFRDIWIAAAAVSAVGFILALFVTDPRSSFNMHVDAPVEEELAANSHHVGQNAATMASDATGNMSNTAGDKV